MSVTTSGNFPGDLKPVIKYYFGQGLDDHPKLYEQMFDKEMTGDAYEDYAVMSGVGAAVLKDEGAAIAYDSGQELFRHVKRVYTYGLGIKFTREMIDDGKILKFAKMYAAQLGEASRLNREIRAADVLNNAFTASYSGVDGIELCATNHPTIDGTYNNELDTPADLSEAALEQAVIDLRDMVDPSGKRKYVRPERLIIPKESEFICARILKGAERPGTANRDINALNKLGYLQNDPIVNPYLTSTSAWFIKTDAKRGLIHLVRREQELTEDNVFDTENVCYKVTFRDAFFHNEPRGIFGSAGA